MRNDPPGRNEGGPRLDWLGNGDVGRIVLVSSLVAYLSVLSFLFFAENNYRFLLSKEKACLKLITNPQAVNSFDKNRFDRPFANVCTKNNRMENEDNQRGEQTASRNKAHLATSRRVNLVVPGPSFTTKETRSCMTTRLYVASIVS